MANRYVRIYNGPENSSVIGFSASAVPDKKDDFEGFLSEKGYEVERFERQTERHTQVIKDLGGVSAAYYGIQPPLQENDKFELLRWCAEHVDPSHNYGFLIDNRMTSGPLQAFHDSDQEIVGQW